MKPMTLEQAREFVKRNAIEHEVLRQRRKIEENNLQYIAETIFAAQQPSSLLNRIGQWIRYVV